MRTRSIARSQGGFSLVEMMVAVTIMVATTAGIFAVLNPAHGTFQAQPELSDMQQRIRVGADMLFKDLIMAGGGAYMGSQAGSLVNFFAPILPYRQGANAALDQSGGAAAPVVDPTSITIFYIPTTMVQTTIGAPMPNVSAELKITDPPSPNCANLTQCGFQIGMTVLIYDNTGAFDTMTITQVQDSANHLQHNQQGPLSKAYDSGAKITQVAQRVYFLNQQTNQLMLYDGGTGNAIPVVDNVVGLNFDYYGEPLAPALAKPGTDESVTYGPSPPALGSQTNPNWPAGENCTFQVVGGQQVSRLAALGAPGSALVRLTDTMLKDGPWCPDAANPNAYDADLLRVRKVIVTVRVQAAIASLRGNLTSTLFVNKGTATSGNQTLPDQEIKFEVSPRNLNLGR